MQGWETAGILKQRSSVDITLMHYLWCGHLFQHSNQDTHGLRMYRIFYVINIDDPVHFDHGVKNHLILYNMRFVWVTGRRRQINSLQPR